MIFTQQRVKFFAFSAFQTYLHNAFVTLRLFRKFEASNHSRNALMMRSQELKHTMKRKKKRKGIQFALHHKMHITHEVQLTLDK
jgi:hypothetical protein